MGCKVITVVIVPVRDIVGRRADGCFAVPKESAVKVHVDQEKCQGHNRCYALAPELFDVDDYGTAKEIGDGTVAPELADKARLAVANCPEFAITITED